MKIRKSTKEDIESIDKIYCRGILDEVKLQFPEKSKDEIIKDLNKNTKNRINGFSKGIISNFGYWIVAEENKKIIAFGQAEINKEDKKKAMLEKLYVLKNYRKIGIASEIMKELLRWLKEKKVESISSGIFVKNIPSINMHKKFGFKITAIRLQKNLTKNEKTK